MNLQTEKVNIKQSSESLFNWLLKIENYEELMPENTKSFRLHESGEGFFVQIGALPEVGMKLKESTPNNQIVFESPSTNFEYQLFVNLKESSTDETEVGIDFDGKFNPMIEMMAKSPLQSFINSIIENLNNKVWL